MDFPIIINKYLAQKGICSRKESDRLLRLGKVWVNGRPAEPGQMIAEGDIVEADAKADFVYLAYNKPRGIITHSPQGDELSIADILKAKEKVFPLGRLDKDSHGLIILTDDGRITDKLLNPDFEHEKEYEVTLSRPVTADFIRRLSGGVRLDDGYVTRRCKAKVVGERSFSIVLTEGKKRQIRRMCQSLGQHVDDLRRVRIMNVRLGDLPAGRFRRLEGEELELFLRGLKAL
jgi:23S rRNA pseudouridine2604 synthase